MKWVLLVIIPVISITAAIFYAFGFFHPGEAREAVDIVPTVTVAVEYEKWTDQSEFEVEYPKYLSLNPHEEDQENYAHLEFTSVDHPGNIIIWVKDENSADISSWEKKNKITGAINTTLGGYEAKKTVTGGDVKEISVSAIRNGYLYQVAGTFDDSSFWTKEFDHMVSSFKFSEISVEEKKTADTYTDESPAEASYDEEEYIE